VTPPARTQTQSDTQTARTITRWLDRLQIDPILGFLVPGVGDLVTGATGLYLVVLAVRLRVPKVTIARMLVNLAVDMAVGIIPVVGDLFDVWFKANQRNLVLLERRAVVPARGADWAYVMGAVILFLAALAVPIVLFAWFLSRVVF
jgi:hypothetical protein